MAEAERLADQGGELIEASNPADIAAVQELWREYWRALGLSLDFQNFEEELAELRSEVPQRWLSELRTVVEAETK